MSLTLLTEPTPTSPPSSADDWGYLNTKVTAMVQAFTGRNPVVGSIIKAGTVIPVGNSLYKATVDETITGTASLYVKITPAGPTATASFVSSLTGVSWNHVTGQYVDGSGNVYLFDEARAVNDGFLSTAYTMIGQISYIKGTLEIGGYLNGVAGLPMTGGPISGVTDITISGSINSKTTNLGSISNTVQLSLVPGETQIFTWTAGLAGETLSIANVGLGQEYTQYLVSRVGTSGISGGSVVNTGLLASTGAITIFNAVSGSDFASFRVHRVR